MYGILAKNETYLGFTDGKPSLQKGKLETCLDKLDRKDFVLESLRNGKRPEAKEEPGKAKKSYRMSWDNYYNEITKTEYYFACYLLENNLVSETAVNAFIDAEKLRKEKAAEEQRKAEEAARKEEAKKEAERKDFETWLEVSAEMCVNTTRGNLLERIYLSLYDNTPSYRAYMIIPCIDNIENPLCREELKSRLYTSNKASRKVFFCLTGLKLPSTNKETMEFLDKVQKSDYTGMIDFKERKKPAEKKEPEINYETFYILRKNEKGENEFTPVLGEKLQKHGIWFFIHESLTAEKRILISSVECGLMIASGKSKREALGKLTEFFKKPGKDAIVNSINNAVNRFGRTPIFQLMEPTEYSL